MTFLPSVNASTLIQKADGNGGFINSVPGNDYQLALWSATAAVTITNTTTETSAMGSTGVGSRTLPANYFSPGKTIRISGNGVYSAAAIAPGNLVIKVKLGSTIIATTTLGAILSGAATLGYDFDVDIVCQTAGASGTVVIGGNIDYASNAAGTRLFGDLTNSGTAVTIDTTATQVVDVTVTWQTASASNIVKNTLSIIEAIW